MNAVDVLDREMYSEAEAARLLRIAQGTLHYWLEGGTQRGRTYKPIVRAVDQRQQVVETLAERACIDPVGWSVKVQMQFVHSHLLSIARRLIVTGATDKR